MSTEQTKQKKAQKPTVKGSLVKAVKGITKNLPVILTVILLISLLKTYVPPKSIVGLFGFSAVTDTAIGALFGSILAGNSINSYIIGEQLLADGVPAAAVTAFLASWVIVGIAQLPAETAVLGRRFALLRAGAGFLLSIAMALIISLLLSGGLS